MSAIEQDFQPAYLKLIAAGEFHERVQAAYEHLSCCDLCAWGCRVDRRLGRVGVCRTTDQATLSSYGPHLGEEDPLRGWRGSGTIFFSHCNMRCQYCQNHDISQGEAGYPIEPEALAAIMLELQHAGCHNINLVSPSHVVPQILAALEMAALAGLRLPIVFNTGGYDSLSALKLLDGVIDIYMPDMKYSSQQTARHYSKVPNYPKFNQAAVKEMHRQVGDLVINDQGLATRGLLVRHLILPNGISGTDEILNFIAQEISPNTYLNLMDQYRPDHNVRKYPAQFKKLTRSITAEEHQSALRAAHELGLHRLDRRRPV